MIDGCQVGMGQVGITHYQSLTPGGGCESYQVMSAPSLSGWLAVRDSIRVGYALPGSGNYLVGTSAVVTDGSGLHIIRALGNRNEKPYRHGRVATCSVAGKVY